MAENPRVLVKLPARSPEGKFEFISPAAVAAIVACSDENRCLVQLHGHSEEGGYWIQLSSQETADRLGITVVERVEQVRSNDEITARVMQSSAACSGYSQRERVTETVATPDGMDPVIIERIELATNRGRVVKTLRPEIDSPLTNGVSVKWSELTRVGPEQDWPPSETEMLREYLSATRSALRQLSEELECNEWPDELHLADVVEKHIGRSTAVQDYRERNTKSASE